MSKKLDTIAATYNELVGFEKTLLKYKVWAIRPYLTGKTLLDVGCGLGFLCKAFAEDFEKVIGIDGSSVKLKKAREINSQHNIMYVETLFENFTTTDQFDTIIVTNVLEHVEDAIGFLKKLKKMLSSAGRIIVTVPNALGLHKRIGKCLCMIRDYYELTAEDVGKGHRRIYDIERLTKDIRKAGLRVITVEGVLLKPLSHRQMEVWDEGICDALYTIGKELPHYCSTLLAVAKSINDHEKSFTD